jgi:hypothetical protein
VVWEPPDGFVLSLWWISDVKSNLWRKLFLFNELLVRMKRTHARIFLYGRFKWKMVVTVLV